MRIQYLAISVMLALILTACETTRTNAPIKVKNSALTQCSTIAQCERVAND